MTGHDHGDGDHDDPPFGALDENPIWIRDNVTLHSIGIDIGSAGTQVAFSRLVMRRQGEHLTSRWTVVERKTLFESEIAFTPFVDDRYIDSVPLGAILDKAYSDAGISQDQVDTGVVILTGEAIRRRNAELIATVVAERAGDLVCASAGHHMEAALAAHGSGAVRISRRDGSRLVNVDIGGGTTKLSLVDNGRVVKTAALHVGGRLLVHEGGMISRLEPAARRHALAVGMDLERGASISDAGLDRLADSMSRAVIAGIRSADSISHLWLTEPWDVGDGLDRLDGVVFSGGVGEYVEGRESRDFGDVGRRLGECVRRRVDAGDLGVPLVPADQRIRATVLGASEFSVQLSGVTSDLVAADRLLPRRNLQVLRPSCDLRDELGPISAPSIAAAIRGHIDVFGLSDDVEELALALSFQGPPEYHRLRAFAEGVVAGLEPYLSNLTGVYLIVDADVARTLGQILRNELGVGVDMLVLDGIELHDFDFVDLSTVRQPSGTVLVTIKSLVFAESMQPRERR